MWRLSVLLAAMAFGSALAAESVEIRHLGYGREFLVHVPKRLPTPAPLVLLLHGAGGGASQALADYKWVDLAEAEGIVVLAANALAARPDLPANAAFNPRFWGDDGGVTQNPRPPADDVGFLIAAIDMAADRWPIDRQRVYATGFSSGSRMAQHLALARADRIAAIGVLAGRAPEDGKPARPVPVIQIAGAIDPLAPLLGGKRKLPWGPETEVPPMAAGPELWARLNGCAPATERPLTDKVTLTEWPSCRDGVAVRYLVVADLGHQWPGGVPSRLTLILGAYSDALDGTKAMWDFLKSWRLP